MATKIEENTSIGENITSPLQSVSQIAEMPNARQATPMVGAVPGRSFHSSGSSGGFFEKLFNAFKFAASAVVGIPAAVSATAFIGSLYLLAEATDIVETNVKSNFKGDKKVYHNPFFQKISDSLGYAVGQTWSQFGAYAPLTTYKAASNFIQDHTAPGLRVSAFVEELAKSNPQFKEALKDLPDIASNRDFYINEARSQMPHVANAIDHFKESSLGPGISPQNAVIQNLQQGHSSHHL